MFIYDIKIDIIYDPYAILIYTMTTFDKDELEINDHIDSEMLSTSIDSLRGASADRTPYPSIVVELNSFAFQNTSDIEE